MKLKAIIIYALCFCLERAWCVEQNACAPGEEIGRNVVADTAPMDPADQYYMVCGGLFDYTCCGSIYEIQYGRMLANEPVELMIWRKTSGSMYDLVGKYTHNANGVGTYTAAFTPEVIIRIGDCIGWHSSGNAVVGYENGGNGEPAVMQTLATAPAPGTSANWGAATASAAGSAKWSILARLNPSTAPFFPDAIKPAETFLPPVTVPYTEALNTLLDKVSASDADTEDKVTLEMSFHKYFKFKDSTGELYTDDIYKVEEIKSQTITVTYTATDLCGKETTVRQRITVSNEKPNITDLVDIQKPNCVREDIKAATSLERFSCTDVDGVETPTLTHVPTNPLGDPFFNIVDVGYPLFELWARAQLDDTKGVFRYDIQSSYDVTVRCTDKLGASTTQTITVCIANNTRPVITGFSPLTNGQIEVKEFTATATSVGTVVSTDVENDDISFSYTTTPAGTFPFKILDGSGEIQTTEVINADNYFGVTSWDIDVTPRDKYGTGLTETITIKLIDLNARPTFTNCIDQTLKENTHPHTLFDLNVNDGDGMDTHEFALTSADGGATYFAIDKTSGVITTKASINYDILPIQQRFVLDITVTDLKSTATCTMTVQITNQNEPHTCNQIVYRHDLDDGAIVNTVIDPGLGFADQDQGDTHLCYSNCGDQDGYFSMSPTDCRLTVAAVYSLDNTTLPTAVTCLLNIKDGANEFSASCTLSIDIKDVNNFTPQFVPLNYQYDLSPYAGADEHIGIITATDIDRGTFGEITYALDQPFGQDYFAINSTGHITTKVNIYNVCNCSEVQFAIPVIATDGGLLKSTATVTIKVSMTTTTTTIITTDEYKKTFDDKRNVIWVACLMAFIAVMGAVTVYICIKYVFAAPCLCRGLFRCNFRNKGKWSRKRDANDFSGNNLAENVVVRNPPPPVAQQAWRKEMV